MKKPAEQYNNIKFTLQKYPLHTIFCCVQGHINFYEGRT